MGYFAFTRRILRLVGKRSDTSDNSTHTAVITSTLSTSLLGSSVMSKSCSRILWHNPSAAATSDARTDASRSFRGSSAATSAVGARFVVLTLAMVFGFSLIASCDFEPARPAKLPEPTAEAKPDYLHRKIAKRKERFEAKKKAAAQEEMPAVFDSGSSHSRKSHSASSDSPTTYVRPYTRKDGTHVRGHERRKPGR